MQLPLFIPVLALCLSTDTLASVVQPRVPRIAAARNDAKAPTVDSPLLGAYQCSASGRKRKKRGLSKDRLVRSVVSAAAEAPSSITLAEPHHTVQEDPSHFPRAAHGNGLFGLIFDGPCPNPNASGDLPNGDIHFLNCRISPADRDGHWAPPHVLMSQLKIASVEQAEESGVFGECDQYNNIWQSVSQATGLPALLLMSFAMQESSCDASLDGDNGEIGMMQLTPDKCVGVDCLDPETNVRIAAEYFAKQLTEYDGNVLEALGTYNGWFRNMTYDQATDERYGCFTQRNLDYIYQMVDGWLQAKDGSQMLVYDNLGHC